MAAPTITEIVTEIAPISEVLASNYVANGSLFGTPINTMWPLQIYIETQSCLWRYNQEDIANGGIPSQRMINNANYLYSIICGQFGQQARGLINPGGSVPVPGGGGGSTSGYSVPIASSYTATSDGEVSLPLSDIFGTPLPVGAIITWVMKSTTPLNLSQYSFSSPTLTLLNGMAMSQDEILSFQYIVPLS